MKPGYKTTEFWLTILPYVGQIVVIGLFAFGLIDQETLTWLLTSGFLGGAFASARYSASRASVKLSKTNV